MITLLNPKAEDKIPAQAGEALKQGQWVYEDGYDSATGEVKVMKVDSDTIAKYDRDRLYLVLKYPIDIASADSVHEDIDSGDMVIRTGNKAGLQVEDSNLTTLSTTADWENASFGAELVLNTSGYLTIAGSGDAGSSRMVVAKFMRYLNGIVFYETVNYRA